MMKSRQLSSKNGASQTITKLIDNIPHSSSLWCLMILCRAASETSLKGILGYTEDDVVSTDFVGDAR
jgi:glyceraldehyde 3-phosphate dehydrogenase